MTLVRMHLSTAHADSAGFFRKIICLTPSLISLDYLRERLSKKLVVSLATVLLGGLDEFLGVVLD